MKQNMKKWILNLSNSIDRYAMPLMTYPGLELSNKTIMDITNDGKAQFECIEALAQRYPSVGTVTVMDLSVEAEAFGSPILFQTKKYLQYRAGLYMIVNRQKH